ncbi:acyltransferase family protein [Pseudomonas paraeruginosa]|uniref:acyltransferase family protein n=1 Tax=Pseudomonas paraeruginosa TaxID=2994495 RepID=UPI0039FD4491
MEEIYILVIFVTSVLVIGSAVKLTGVTANETINRHSPIDALRGWLATSVACHHALITYTWKTEGEWKDSASHFISNMGSIPVSIFFMITAFLFFGKIYRKTPVWTDIITSRLTRILPLYYTLVGVVIIISIASTDFHIIDAKSLSIQILKWLLFLGVPINGFDDSRNILAGVQWTLIYESIFYISLPVIAVFSSKQTSRTAFLTSLAFISLIFTVGIAKEIIRPGLFALFAIGAIPVLLKRNYKHVHDAMRSKFASSISAASMIIAFTATEKYSPTQMVLCGIAFIPIALGNDMFGILRSRGAKSLGEISYSIYLTHGIVLYALFSIIELSIHEISIYVFTLYIPLVIALTSALSVLTYKNIERPWIEFAKRKSLSRNDGKVKGAA